MNAPSPYHPASFSFRLLTEKHVECRDEANTPTTEAPQISKAFDWGRNLFKGVKGNCPSHFGWFWRTVRQYLVRWNWSMQHQFFRHLILTMLGSGSSTPSCFFPRLEPVKMARPGCVFSLQGWNNRVPVAVLVIHDLFQEGHPCPPSLASAEVCVKLVVFGARHFFCSVSWAWTLGTEEKVDFVGKKIDNCDDFDVTPEFCWRAHGLW